MRKIRLLSQNHRFTVAREFISRLLLPRMNLGATLAGFLLLSVPVFSYQLKGIVCSGASHGSSSNYKLLGVTGIVGYKVFGGQEHGVEEKGIAQEIKFYVHNYPNPTSYGAWIEYGIPKATSVSLKVYDLAGRDIRTLSAGSQKPGTYKIYWDGTNAQGRKVATGIYFYRMEAGDYKATEKLTIIR